MKKVFTVLIVSICLLMTGCNNDFARKEYDSNEKIKGQAKIVHIDDDGNVTTVIECAPETSTDGFVTKTVSLSSGQNRLKIVGYGCEDIEFEMLFTEPQ